MRCLFGMNNSLSSSLKVKTTDEVKFQTLIPIPCVLIRDFAWSSNDTSHIWEVVDTDGQGTGQEIAHMFVNKTAEEKRLFVMAIKEATKLSSTASSMSPRNPPAVPPKPRSHKDHNQNSTILPSRPNLLANKMRRMESKCSDNSARGISNKGRHRFHSDSDSSSQSTGVESGLGSDSNFFVKTNGRNIAKKISNAF